MAGVLLEWLRTEVSLRETLQILAYVTLVILVLVHEIRLTRLERVERRRATRRAWTRQQRSARHAVDRAGCYHQFGLCRGQKFADGWATPEHRAPRD